MQSEFRLTFLPFTKLLKSQIVCLTATALVILTVYDRPVLLEFSTFHLNTVTVYCVDDQFAPYTKKKLT